MANGTDVSFDCFWNIVDGERRGSSRVHQGTNPATGKPLWDVPIATEEDVNEAVRAAQKAFPKWSATEYSTRAQLLNQFADAFLQLAPEFTALLQAETGRTKEVAQVEVHWSVLWLRHPASQVLPHQVLQDQDNQVTIRYEPRGVVAAICPWNYPIMLAFGKVAPALAVGNCVIVKPAPSTPYTTLKCIELAQSIFPPGVLQVLADDGRLGPLLVDHPGIAHISFTGSTPTGKRIMEAAAKTLKKVTLELSVPTDSARSVKQADTVRGGNDAAIILPDVDIEKVAPQVAMGAWWNSGQSCIAIKRVRSQVTVGRSPVDGATVLGPIQNKMQYQKLRNLIESCRRTGCKFSLDQPLTAEDDLAQQSLESGFFLWPMIVDNPPTDSPLVTEEQFGPIIPCMPFSDTDAVIAAANSTSTGLSASVWGEDVETTQRIADSLDVGTVFVNGPSRPDPRVPFSGHKESGIGAEYGLMGLIEYCQVKSVVRYRVSS